MVISVVFALLGTLAGVVEIVLLRRTVGPGVGPFGVVVRLLLVGSVLYIAALEGHLIPAAAGWAVGFLGAMVGTLAYRKV